MSDLLLLVKADYLTKKEAQDILKQRESHEYSFRSTKQSPVTYLKAIEYEYSLERHRKQAFIDKEMKKEGGKDFQFIKRIIRLYDRMCNRYKKHQNLWMDYLRFCYHIKSKKYFAKALEGCLKTNMTDTLIWRLAAAFEDEVNNNPFQARKVFFRALRVNTSDQHLWKAYFSFELAFLSKLKKRAQILNQDSQIKDKKEEGVLDLDVIKFNNDDEQDLIDISSDHNAVLRAIYDSARQQVGSHQVCLVVMGLLQQ